MEEVVVDRVQGSSGMLVRLESSKRELMRHLEKSYKASLCIVHCGKGTHLAVMVPNAASSSFASAQYADRQARGC